MNDSTIIALTPSVPMSPDHSQAVTPSVSRPSISTHSQAAAPIASTTLDIGHTEIIEGTREVADVWDWATLTGREWSSLTEARWDEFRADELVTAEHWTLGRTQIAVRLDSAAEGGARTTFAESPPSESSQIGGEP